MVQKIPPSIAISDDEGKVSLPTKLITNYHASTTPGREKRNSWIFLKICRMVSTGKLNPKSMQNFMVN